MIQGQITGSTVGDALIAAMKSGAAADQTRSAALTDSLSGMSDTLLAYRKIAVDRGYDQLAKIAANSGVPMAAWVGQNRDKAAAIFGKIPGFDVNGALDAIAAGPMGVDEQQKTTAAMGMAGTLEQGMTAVPEQRPAVPTTEQVVASFQGGGKGPVSAPPAPATMPKQTGSAATYRVKPLVGTTPAEQNRATKLSELINSLSSLKSRGLITPDQDAALLSYSNELKGLIKYVAFQGDAPNPQNLSASPFEAQINQMGGKVITGADGKPRLFTSEADAKTALDTASGVSVLEAGRSSGMGAPAPETLSVLESRRAAGMPASGPATASAAPTASAPAPAAAQVPAGSDGRAFWKWMYDKGLVKTDPAKVSDAAITKLITDNPGNYRNFKAQSASTPVTPAPSASSATPAATTTQPTAGSAVPAEVSAPSLAVPKDVVEIKRGLRMIPGEIKANPELTKGMDQSFVNRMRISAQNQQNTLSGQGILQYYTDLAVQSPKLAQDKLTTDIMKTVAETNLYTNRAGSVDKVGSDAYAAYTDRLKALKDVAQAKVYAMAESNKFVQTALLATKDAEVALQTAIQEAVKKAPTNGVKVSDKVIADFGATPLGKNYFDTRAAIFQAAGLPLTAKDVMAMQKADTKWLFFGSGQKDVPVTQVGIAETPEQAALRKQQELGLGTGAQSAEELRKQQDILARVGATK